MKLSPLAAAIRFTTHVPMPMAAMDINIHRLADHHQTQRITFERKARPCGQTSQAHAAKLLQQALSAPDAAATYASHLTTARLKVWSAPNGADATQLLAMLMVVIGTPCECGARRYGHAPAWVRQLHGALRAIRDMCANGYRWDSAAAPMLDRAIQLAAEHRPDLDRETFVASWLEANAIASAIERHQFMTTEIT